MARHHRVREAGQPWHIWQRGVNRCECFAGPGDRARYLSLLAEHAARQACDVHAYVLMTNHVHLLVTPRERFAASRMMKDVNQRYVQTFNRATRRTGTLWEGRFHSSVIESMHYLFACQRYIELNPVRARMVGHPAEHQWSSYRTNADGEPSRVITPHPLYMALAGDAEQRRRAYRAFFEKSLTEDELRQIRQAIMSGRALGAPTHSWALNTSVGLSPERMREPPRRPFVEAHAT